MRACLKGCAGSTDVINQQQLLAVNVSRAKPFPTYDKRAGDICSPAVGRELDLGSRGSTAAQGALNGWTEIPGDLVGLIEDALIFPAPMQWYGYDAIDLFDQLSRSLPHSIGKRPR